uniref:Uncharacterized protein n=1 Tax=Ditylenchus dipsaci TaxID=166011 RepID=A0A915EJU0_9BILA
MEDLKLDQAAEAMEQVVEKDPNGQLGCVPELPQKGSENFKEVGASSKNQTGQPGSTEPVESLEPAQGSSSTTKVV